MSAPSATLTPVYGSVANAENPWPGLLSFREADSRWFQGRREETAELLRLVRQERLTVVFALSGIGKSSLLQAGLFPALRAGEIFPVYVRLDHSAAATDLASQVFDAILQAGAASDVRVPVHMAGETLWEYFHNIQSEFWDRRQNRVLPLLVFDQFEEIFTLGKSDRRSNSSETFLADLADLADDTVPEAVALRWAANPSERDDFATEGEYKILISLREDFLPEMQDQRRRLAGVHQRFYRLRQMNGEGALLAVSQAKDLVDEAVAAQIVRYVSAGDAANLVRRTLPLKELEVEPALLSVVCRELNDRRRQRGERRISADLLEGNHEAILSKFYESSFAGLGPQVSAFVEEKLITVGGARNSVSQEDALAAPGMSAATVETLVERRLLRREFRPDAVRLELTHDLLTGIVRSNRDKRRNAEALAEQQEKERRARASAARNRKLAVGFGAIAAAALAAAGVAGYATVQANKQTVLAQNASREAQAALKKEQEARNAEAAATQAATESAARAKVSEGKAVEEAQNAIAQKAEADRQTVRANKGFTEAEKQTALAKISADEALAKAEAARVAEEDAKRQELRAEANAAEVQRQAEIVATQKAAAEKENARGQVDAAVSQVGSGQHEKAFGDIARALSLDPNSMAARSLAFDQLLRAPISHLSATGTGLYIHPAIGHTARVIFAAYSPDGAHIATGSYDGTVRLWDSAGRSEGELEGHKLYVGTVAFSPDGKRLVTASQDGTARVWDVASKQQLLELRHGSRVTSASFSHDGQKVVTSSQDHTAQVWDAASGAKIGGPLAHPMTVNFASISPSGQSVVTACEDGFARIWGSSGSMSRQLKHPSAVKSAVFSPDGSRVLTASADFNARIWVVETGAAEGEIMRHTAPVLFASYSPHGERVATASMDRSARVWESRTGRSITGPLSHSDNVLSASFSPNGNRLITTSGTAARVWEVYHNFDRVGDLVKLLQGVGRVSAEENAPALSAEQADAFFEEVRTKPDPPTGATADFIKWFLSHRT